MVFVLFWFFNFSLQAIWRNFVIFKQSIVAKAVIFYFGTLFAHYINIEN